MSALLQTLMQNMDLVSLRRVDGDLFEVLHPVNPWFAEIFPGAGENARLALRGVLPFLDNFLLDASEHWAQHRTVALRSGPFVETVSDGTQFPMEATAITVGEDRLLILASLGDSYEQARHLMQSARDNLLVQEGLEVEISKRTQEIRDREAEIAARLIHATGFRDEETGAHIRRIGLYSVEMARALGWSQTGIDDIRIAAPMHDIGKIAIPDYILRKPDTLTEEEWVIMKTHTTRGGAMLADSDITMVQMAADIALGHHERWDGTGYPEGLAGEDIPLSARIVAIVDVYDALSHKRVYKEAMLEDEVIRIMQESRGSHFDPRLLDLFFEHLDTMRRIRLQVRDDE